MKEIIIGQSKLKVKDYHCTCGDLPYLEKEECKLWLYINLTDGCNACCPFCVNLSLGKRTVSIDKLKMTLEKIKPLVYGISITGGEPMLFPDLVDEVAEVVDTIFDNGVQLELATNGTNLDLLLKLKMFDRFESIHISRHKIIDEANRELMGFNSPLWEDIRHLIERIDDKAKIVLNCVMQRSGVDSVKEVSNFLEESVRAGVKNVSFVGLIRANDYCTENYLNPAQLDFGNDERFSIWNKHYDYNFCSCSNGAYSTTNGIVRFYYRCPDVKSASYCRQLVYSTDNKLLDGFDGNEILFSELKNDVDEMLEK